ncbi:hypothetical protein SSAG_04055 [Streptomyces sp. Mg1]|nr:hypothetical protein SSAG_04055 [Streptomyces sp. Mg1]
MPAAHARRPSPSAPHRPAPAQPVGVRTHQSKAVPGDQTTTGPPPTTNGCGCTP